MNEPHKSVGAIFDAAIELPPERRAAYVQQACASDDASRRRVEALLRAHESAGTFMDNPAVAPRGESVVVKPAEQPGDRIGRYKLLQQIGEGGCGVVYMAEQEEPIRRRVALKVIKLGMDTRSVIARFEAERQALALMDHPNIARVFDAGATETGRPFFVMELVRGVKITEYCDKNNLSTEERLKLFTQVCQAIQHAHQKGIIHRDIKPSNILVTVSEPGAPGSPKVIDFGIAKATSGQHLTDKTVFTAFEQFIGTPAYMSPEQATLTTIEVDTRTDIYALGVLLYELLTGQTPFDAKDLMAAGLDAMRRIILEKEPARPSTRLSTMVHDELTTTARHRRIEAPKLIHRLRGDLDWIAMKALEKDRARRYETANGLAMDVQRHLNCEPVLARPPSRLYEFQKTVRRHKFAFVAAAAVLAALVLGVTVSSWQALRATGAERQQSVLRAEAENARRNEAGMRQAAQTEASRAEAAAMDLKMTLSRSDFMQSVRLVNESKGSDALAFLTRSLSANPTNDAALARLTTLLTYYPCMLPTLQLSHDDRVGSVQFSPDGKRILTASGYAARLWDTETGRLLAEPMKHSYPVNSAQFSPDGKRIVTASNDKTARVWDAQSGRPLTEPMEHDNWVKSARFSPDGKKIVTGSLGSTVRVWDASTGKPLTQAMNHKYALKKEATQPAASNQTITSQNVVGYSKSADGRIELVSAGRPATAQFSPDAKRIVTTAEDKTARVWDAQTGEPLTGLLEHDSKVISAQFSPDAKQIVTIADDMTVRVWDAQTGQALAIPMKHDGPVNSAQFSPDGKRIVTASEDKTARVWDAQTGLPLTGPMPHGSSVYSARFNVDGKQIVTASLDNLGRVWDTQTGQLLSEGMNLGNHLSTVEVSSDGKRLITISGDSTVQVWDARSAPALALTIDQARSAQFSPNGKRILSVSSDRTFQLRDAQTGQALTEPTNWGTNVFSAKFSPDGKRIVTVSYDNLARAFGDTARVWDAQTGKLLTETTKNGGSVESAEFSLDGKRIVTASADKTATVWDAETGQAIMKTMRTRKSPGSVNGSVHFSPDGKRILTASWVDAVRVWDAQTGEILAETMKDSSDLRSAEFSPDGKWIVTVDDVKNFARVWDAQTGRSLAEPMKHGGAVSAAKFSPEGKRIVTASVDKTARVWDAQTGQPLTEPLTHAGPVDSAEFSPDGKRIVTASEDMTARLWDAQTGQPLTGPMKHDAGVWLAQFSPDGRRILTLSADRSARVWDIGPTTRHPDWLLQLTEAISGQVLNKQGVLEPTRLDRLETLREIREQLKQQPDDDDWVVWGRWFFADRATRAISPFSKMTVPEYIEHRIIEGTPRSFAEAEQLAADKPEVLQRISEARERAETLALLRTRHIFLASHGRWKEAAADIAKLIELEPADHTLYHSLAALLVQTGDVAGYRRNCAQELTRFAGTSDPNTAERMAKDCLILRDSGVDLNAVNAWADTAVTASKNSGDLEWFQFCKALAEYRREHFDEAVGWAKKALAHEGDALERDVEAYTVLAMAQYRSNQADDAGIALGKGIEIAERKLPKLDSGDLGDGWLDCIIAEVLMREAKALIKDPSRPAAAPSPPR